MGQLVEFFDKGGPVLIVIVVVFFVGLFIFFERLFHLLRIKARLSQSTSQAVSIVSQGSLTQLRQKFSKLNDPFSRSVVKLVDDMKSGQLIDKDHLESIHEDSVSKLANGMRLLGTTTSVSPLLGFLGTTTGMVKIFAKIREVGGLREQAQFAGGISEALYTTVAGLISAITLTILSNILWELIERYEMESREAFHKVAGLVLEARRKGAQV